MDDYLTKTEEELLNFFWKTKIEFTFAELLEYFAEVKGWKKRTLKRKLERLEGAGS